MRLSVNGFGGIDQRLEFDKKVGLASDMMNFRVTDSGSLVKRNGVAWLWNAPEKVDCIWSGNIGNQEMVIVASGGQLFRIWPNRAPAQGMLLGNIGAGKCLMFEFNGLLYIMTETTYHKYDGDMLRHVNGYIPLVALSCNPDGKGVVFEQLNLITDRRRQQFSSDGTSTTYLLAEREISGVFSIKINGENANGYSVDNEKGQVKFNAPPPLGTNNIEIIYTKNNDESFKQRILGCTKMMIFGGNSDGRLFLWGNKNFPNYRFHSDLANGIPSAEYFPVNAFTMIGNSKINCIVQQYDKQLIFTDNQAFYSYCELREDSLGNTYSSFPVFSLNNGKGCIIETNGCIIDNRPITLCNDGLNMWESTSVVNEKNAVCISGPIQKAIREIIGRDITNIRLFDFQAYREMFFICDDVAYIYNYGNGTWYRYGDFQVDCFSVYGRLLYFSRNDVMYLFGNDYQQDLENVAFWEGIYLDGGQDFGRFDLVKFEVDLYIKGNENLRLEFQKSGFLTLSTRELHFDEGDGKLLRISMRPHLKRAMPFKIIFTDNGPGECILHGFSLKTRNKERSLRDGIL